MGQEPWLFHNNSVPQSLERFVIRQMVEYLSRSCEPFLSFTFLVTTNEASTIAYQPIKFWRLKQSKSSLAKIQNPWFILLESRTVNLLFAEGILQKQRDTRSASEFLDFMFIFPSWRISERVFSTTWYVLCYRSKRITPVNLELKQSLNAIWNLRRIPDIKKLISKFSVIASKYLFWWVGYNYSIELVLWRDYFISTKQ